jgi:hypothetical protein
MRSSFAMREALHSQTRRVTPSFWYSRLRSSPSTWICTPVLRETAKSASLDQQTIRCHSVRDSQSPVSLFFHDYLVATDRTVTGMPLLVNFCSPSFPVNPMSERRYMMCFTFLPWCVGATQSAWAPLPSKGPLFAAGSEDFQRAVFARRSENLWGTANPSRREAKQRNRSAPGRGIQPRSRAQHRGQKGLTSWKEHLFLGLRKMVNGGVETF